ncbi:MAG: sulfurtransferase TusA family protein [Actinomycetales bacterium]|nr:sulfurtransferase TusA family protein [Actinomycetales bacterium]
MVDARGLRCPIPVLRLAKAAAGAADGAEIEVWATDPAAEPDIRAWARMRGHTFLGAAPLEATKHDDDGDHRAAVVVKVRVSRST